MQWDDINLRSVSIIKLRSELTKLLLDKKLKNISKLWLFSTKLFTVVVLVILPLISMLTTLFYEQIYLFFEKYSHSGNAVVGLIYYFQIVVFFIMLLAYPPYPAPISTKGYFEARGYENAVLEYE